MGTAKFVVYVKCLLQTMHLFWGANFFPPSSTLFPGSANITHFSPHLSPIVQMGGNIAKQDRDKDLRFF